MSMTIYDSRLTGLMPPGMQGEAEIKAYCAAFDAMFAIMVSAIGKLRIQTNIGGQDSDVTDLLAIEKHVDYYNRSLPLETRQNLVKNSGYIHKIKGTPAAVEKVARLVFGSAVMQEWFEYGGSPYHFRMLINEFPDSSSQIDEVKRAIASSQRLSSVLDSVNIIAATAKGTIYAAGVVQITIKINVTQK